jgi:hypothetical protein
MQREHIIARHPTLAVAALLDALDSGLSVKLSTNSLGDKFRTVVQNPTTEYGARTAASNGDTLAASLYLAVLAASQRGWTGTLVHCTAQQRKIRKGTISVAGQDKLLHPEVGAELDARDSQAAGAFGRLEAFMLESKGEVVLIPADDGYDDTQAESVEVLLKARNASGPVMEHVSFIADIEDLIDLLESLR